MWIGSIDAKRPRSNKLAGSPRRHGPRSWTADSLAQLGVILVTGLAGLGGCAFEHANVGENPLVGETAIPQPSSEPEAGFLKRFATADVEMVDCQLPPTIRRLGTNLVYLGSRRQARITARDCAIRGGALIAFDLEGNPT